MMRRTIERLCPDPDCGCVVASVVVEADNSAAMVAALYDALGDLLIELVDPDGEEVQF